MGMKSRIPVSYTVSPWGGGDGRDGRSEPTACGLRESDPTTLHSTRTAKKGRGEQEDRGRQMILPIRKTLSSTHTPADERGWLAPFGRVEVSRWQTGWTEDQQAANRPTANSQQPTSNRPAVIRPVAVGPLCRPLVSLSVWDSLSLSESV